jgi:hypothetical protein
MGTTNCVSSRACHVEAGTGAGAPVEAVAYLEPVPGARIAAELGASCGDTNTYVPFRIPITVARDRPAHLLNRVNGWNY